ncbi:MAG: hypothetical protein Athens041674_872 [Parcubacteria group bacterium Athens0416_74]|nr:MAG: hypothetical protein Athens041674_872 [Parcubacteria group bacterium Athens0416_74]
MGLMSAGFMPNWVVRVRNAIRDYRIEHAYPGVEKHRFHDGLTERGLLRISEPHGPAYPQSFLDLECLYRDNRYRFDRKLLFKAGRLHPEFRGLVHFQRPDILPVYTMEFCYPSATVLVVFLDLDYADERCVRPIVSHGALPPEKMCELVGRLFDRLEYGLLPKEVRIRDGGRTLERITA